MKPNSVLAVFSTTILLTALGAATVAAEEVREEFHQTYPLAQDGRVELDNVNGDVHIATWDRAEIKVDAVKRAKKQAHLDEVKIVVDTRADHIQIKTKYPEAKGWWRRNNNSTSVDYTLTVPKTSRLESINTVNGGIDIENVHGGVKANSVNGHVNATGAIGDVRLSTVNGSVRASFGALKNSVALNSVNGSVTVALPADVNADVSANTVNGGISSEFALQATAHFPISKDMHGKLGQGGPDVRMSTVNGGIHLDRAQTVLLEKP